MIDRLGQHHPREDEPEKTICLSSYSKDSPKEL